MIPSNYKICNGNVFLDKTQIYSMSINFYLLYLKFFKNDISVEQLLEIYEETSNDDLFIFVSNLKKNNNPNLNIQSIGDMFEIMGYGKINILSFKENKIKFGIKKLSLTKYYKMYLDDFDGYVVEKLFIPNFKKIVSMYFEKLCSVDVCVDNNKYLEFNVIISNEKYEFKTDKTYDVPNENSMNKSIFNMISNKNINCENGEFSISNMKQINFPYFAFFNTLEFAYSDELKKYFNNLSYLEGINFVKINKLFGRKDSKKLFLQCAECFGVYGRGEFTSLSDDFKKVKINNSFFKTAEKYYDEKIIDLVFRNICETYRGMYNKSFGVNSKINCLDNFEFEIIELNEEETLSESDLFILECLSYKNLLIQK